MRMYYLFSSVHISSIGAENDRKVERSKERQQPYAEVLCLTFLLVFAFLILVSLAFGRVNIRRLYAIFSMVHTAPSTTAGRKASVK